MHVSKPRVSTANASNTTVRRRSKELSLHRKRVSGGDEMVQLSSEIQLSSKQERQLLIEEMMKLPGNFSVVVSPQESLAMKTDLQLPWRKLRVMKR